jgi:TRAP-type C4-dicarboxylate transport system permease small subunit
MTVADFIKKAGQYGSAVLMLAVTVVMSVQIISRYIFNSPIDWTEEVCRILFIAMIFVGAVSADHIRVDVIPTTINQKFQKIIDLVILILHTVYFIIILVVFLYYQRPGKSFSTPMLDIPMYYLLAIAPICFGLIVIKDWTSLKKTQ